MKLKKSLFFVSSFVFLLCSCNNGEAVSKLQNENDSLKVVNKQQGKILDDLTSTIVEVSSTLDSLNQEENAIKIKMQEGGFLTKKQLLANLSDFKTKVENYKLKLAELEKQLSGRNDQLAKMNNIINFLSQELEKKEATIKQLQSEIAQKNTDIKRLSSEITDLGTTIGNLKEENDNQRETISKQESSLNTVYYIIGTSKELKEKKLLTGGFLQKKKIDISGIDQSLFNKVDVRKLNEIEINSKSAKVLTPNPKESYSIEKVSKNSCKLVIHDSSKFWNVTNILIIMKD